jgi:hypothetical protein
MWLLYNHCSPGESSSLQRWNDAGRNVQFGCPRAIHDYFYRARSVDVLSQLHYAYLPGRKAQRCWPRLAWWLIVHHQRLPALVERSSSILDSCAFARSSCMSCSSNYRSSRSHIELEYYLVLLLHWPRTTILHTPRSEATVPFAVTSLMHARDRASFVRSVVCTFAREPASRLITQINKRLAVPRCNLC